MNLSNQYILALEKGDLKKAELILTNTISNGSIEEQYDMSESLRELGFLEQAALLLKNLLELFPGEGELLIELAEIYVDLDQEEKALDILDNIDKDDPYFAEALLLQADLYQLQGLFEVSEQKLLAAQDLMPKEPVIQFALAELYASIGRFAEAVYKYEQVLKETKQVAGISILQRLAESYSASGEFEKALEYYDQALEEKLDINSLFGYGLTAYQAGYHTKAIQKLTEVIELDPEFESAYLPLARAYEHEEDLQNALTVAQNGSKVDPYNKEILNVAGKISLKLGNETDAEKYLREALQIDSAYLEALLVLNKLFLRQERYEDLISLVEPIITDGEDDPEILWDYAVACQEEERYTDALNSYRRAYIYLKEKEEFLQNYGFFLLEEGISDDAIEVFKQLQKIDPTNVDYTDVLERLQSF